MQPGVTYFLSSLDSSRFAAVRECLLVKELVFETGKDCALVRLNPPVGGQEFGLADDIVDVVLAARFEGGPLFPISEFPCFVFVARPLKGGPANREAIAKDELEVIGIGELYRSRTEAENKIFD